MRELRRDIRVRDRVAAAKIAGCTEGHLELNQLSMARGRWLNGRDMSPPSLDKLFQDFGVERDDRFAFGATPLRGRGSPASAEANWTPLFDASVIFTSAPNRRGLARTGFIDRADDRVYRNSLRSSSFRFLLLVDPTACTEGICEIETSVKRFNHSTIPDRPDLQSMFRNSDCRA